MYRSPRSDEEETPDIPEFSYPAKRRRSSGTGYTPPRKRAPEDYRTDERPGEPRVRRASLLREQQAQLERQTPTEPEEEERSVSRQPTRPARGYSGKSQAPTQQRRALSPPVRQQARPTKQPALHRPSSARGVLARPVFNRKQVITIIGIAALLLALLIPILLQARRASPTVSVSTPAPGITPPSFSGQPLPSHELVIIPQDTDHPAPPVNAASAYLLDAGTGSTLYAVNPFTHLPMLSTTKLLTASIAVEKGNLDQRITITAAMWRDIGKLSPDSALFGVKQGQTYTLRDLLYGLLFVSGNDAAIAIADALDGNLQTFVAEMNTKAQQLGMLDSHFMNPHGLLQAGQYSSARDLALLGRYSMSLSALRAISGAKAYDIPAGGNHPERKLINENQFLWWYPGVDGGKTGYDGQSDFIQVMSVTRNNHHLIGVVMHTNNWWTDMRDLMNWGFGTFAWISPHDVDARYPIPYDYLWNYFASDTKDKTIPTADRGRYYIYTGYSISGPILAYYDAHGGLKTFGYPIKMPEGTSNALISQQFEHGAIQCNPATNQCQKA